MKQVLVGMMLLTTAACGGSSDDDASTGGHGGGGSGGSGGSGGTTMKCGTHAPTLLYASDKALQGPDVDDASVFVVEGGKSIGRIPKEGGKAETVATIPTVGIPDVRTRVYVDGTKLYFSDDAALWSVDKAGGTPVALAMTESDIATGIDPLFTFDDDFIYYGDYVSTDAGDENGTLNKVKKSGGTPTVLATGLAGPGSVALDGSDVYFINDGTIDHAFHSLYNGSVATVPKAGGTVRELFTQEPNKDAIAPSEGDLLVTSSTLYFSSLNINNILNYGEYSLPKSGGKPVEFSDCPTLGAFIEGDTMVANCGDRIAKFDLVTGDETELVCFPVPLEGATAMTHDAKTLYYTKHEPDNASGDTNYAVYSIPIE